MRVTTAAPAHPARRPGDDERPRARALLSGLILFALAAMAVDALPESAVRRALLPAVEPFLDLTGLHQNWNLFAPEPRRATLELKARLTYADGTTLVWRPPRGNQVIGVYRGFRWRKWVERIVSPTARARWPEVARWLARGHPRDGRWPVRVVLVRRSSVAPPPGSGLPARQPFREQVLYEARFEAAASR
jgi:hypothetical protein